jgi:hypothetical protein
MRCKRCIYIAKTSEREDETQIQTAHSAPTLRCDANVAFLLGRHRNERTRRGPCTQRTPPRHGHVGRPTRRARRRGQKDGRASSAPDEKTRQARRGLCRGIWEEPVESSRGRVRGRAAFRPGRRSGRAGGACRSGRTCPRSRQSTLRVSVSSVLEDADEDGYTPYFSTLARLSSHGTIVLRNVCWSVVDPLPAGSDAIKTRQVTNH